MGGEKQVKEFTHIFCTDCGQWMKKIQLNYEVEINEHQAVNGDLYQCPECGHEVICDIGEVFNKE